MTTALATPRALTRITTKLDLGPDEQVDAKGLIFVPREPALVPLMDPFLALVEDKMSSRGFEWHPHRGLETVTFVVDGVLEHGDNKGHAGALERDGVQWMTAGHGIIHRELAYRDEKAHVLQMWLNLPAAAKLVPAGYQDLVSSTMPRVTPPGITIDVHSGTVAGVTGAARNQHPVQGLVITLDPGTSYDLAVAADHRLFAYTLDGTGSVGGRALHSTQVGWSDPLPLTGDGSTTLTIRAADRGERMRVMVYSGTPLQEPVALGGPFVMNSKLEVTQAFADFHAGHFGAVPRQARLAYDR